MNKAVIKRRAMIVFLVALTVATYAHNVGWF